MATQSGSRTILESPYPPRKDGYVGCLTGTQEAALAELVEKLIDAVHASDLNGPEQLTLWGVPLADLAAPHRWDEPEPADKQQQQQQSTSTPTAAASNGNGHGAAAASGLQRASAGGASPRTPTKAQKVVLLKFLRARQWNVAAAVTMLVNCLRWRRDFDVASLSLEAFPQQLAAAGQLTGHDRAGNPVTYNYYGTGVDLNSVMGSPGGVATFVRWRVRLMEQAVAALDWERGVEHVTQVHDYAGASMFRMDAGVKAASREIIRLFQDNYPELLSAKLFLNVPRVMEFLFGVFSGLADAATRAKFTMASPARAATVLFTYVDPVQVPARFGGFLESFGIPPKNKHAPPFSAARSKCLTLQPGEGHVTGDLAGAEAEVAWAFVSTGPPLAVTLSFRPRDNEEAAAATARLPDHIQGASVAGYGEEAQYLTCSHDMALTREAASGRLVLGVPGEVTLTMDNTCGKAGIFTGPPNATVHYALISSSAPVRGGGGAAAAAAPTGSGGPGSLTAAAGASSTAAGGGGGEAGAAGGGGGGGGDSVASNALYEASAGRLQFMDSRNRIISYKSLGCTSLTSEDVGLADLGGSMPHSPSAAAAAAQRAGQLVGGPSRGQFEAVPEGDDEAAASSRQQSVAGTPRGTGGGAEQGAK
ncbi:hypothetical protein HYH02_000498 [Chlamydomonas schloesseri]|uniref:CRAL-TRIO domain-containing protein n=1 Tax=Chlamydomonas schloesseri TaxID=2026947 RepID=A0A836BCX2_9CHLO|nr:hypothetical protein HYH02_000498 [Chlamydomonas schloesseri]|eukprot:KAG2454658.1 hypothetical protein HYH02_000498 [Chlamydomonas schloesseri]